MFAQAHYYYRWSVDVGVFTPSLFLRVEMVSTARWMATLNEWNCISISKNCCCSLLLSSFYTKILTNSVTLLIKYRAPDCYSLTVWFYRFAVRCVAWWMMSGSVNVSKPFWIFRHWYQTNIEHSQTPPKAATLKWTNGIQNMIELESMSIVKYTYGI